MSLYNCIKLSLNYNYIDVKKREREQVILVRKEERFQVIRDAIISSIRHRIANSFAML